MGFELVGRDARKEVFSPDRQAALPSIASESVHHCDSYFRESLYHSSSETLTCLPCCPASAGGKKRPESHTRRPFHSQNPTPQPLEPGVRRSLRSAQKNRQARPETRHLIPRGRRPPPPRGEEASWDKCRERLVSDSAESDRKGQRAAHAFTRS